MRSVDTLVLGLFLCTVAPVAAHATPNFPRVIEDTVGTAGPPPCSVCHQGDIRNNYSVKTPFGAALKQHGLVPEDASSLRTARAKLRSEATDSDHDGVSDIAELEAGYDPNVPGDQPAGPRPQYGCSVVVAQRVQMSSMGAPTAWLAALLATVLVLRKRRRNARARDDARARRYATSRCA